MQPAWESGQFQEGDILISAGGQPLSGLTLRQALDVLRSSPPVTTIFVCRPRAEQFLVVCFHDNFSRVPEQNGNFKNLCHSHCSKNYSFGQEIDSRYKA